MKVIPNFIQNENIAKGIKNILLGEKFDWFYLPTLVSKEDKNDFMFWHNFIFIIFHGYNLFYIVGI